MIEFPDHQTSLFLTFSDKPEDLRDYTGATDAADTFSEGNLC